LKQCQAFAWLRSARQWRGCEGREDHYMGSPVIRYDSALLSAMLGDSFALIETAVTIIGPRWAAFSAFSSACSATSSGWLFGYANASA
jgi:hypothetical protein